MGIERRGKGKAWARGGEKRRDERKCKERRRKGWREEVKREVMKVRDGKE